MRKTTFLLILWLLTAATVGAQDRADSVRNVIFMIGDGMGLAHISMLQIENDYAPTAFERAEGVALVVTRSANNRVTDSAAAGTALATGHKTGNGRLGQDMEGRRLESLVARAHAAGRPTGIVVTSYLQHATPAAFYAHVGDRGDQRTITGQLLESGVDVLLGGGRKWLAAECAEGGSYYDAFRRRGYQVIDTLPAADTIRSGRLLGALAEGHMPGLPERGDYLCRATRKALDILSADAAGGGFVLMVEGSLIDMAAHSNDAKELVGELRDFECAVAAAMDFADRTPGTLVVVVADHETGGLSIPANKTDFTQAENGLNYNFGTRSHTASMVPAYLYGTGARGLSGVMDNTELSRRVGRLAGLE
ncbi:alkaline phosphatase [Alistipes sp.]|uniref:alkaline phosphatase n=1 Tax=Alistipes sp. TaxID=1872444 RepID=UPI003AF0B2C8